MPDETLGPLPVQPNDIVQANPERSDWGPALVVVTEVRAWGVIGYTHIPRSGSAFIRLSWPDIVPTGGRAVFIRSDDDAR